MPFPHATYTSSTTVNFISTTRKPEDPYQFLLPWWQQTILYFSFVAILLISGGGNLAVMWIVLAHKRMRTVTNYFLVNLALADLLISLLNLLLRFYTCCIKTGGSDRSSAKYRVLYPSASVLTFMAIAVDRYIAILYPLRPRMPKRHVIMTIIFIWLFSIVLAFPNRIYFETATYLAGTICFITWPIETDIAYNYILLVLNYLLSFLTLVSVYSRVWMEFLEQRRAIGEETSIQTDRVKSKQKVVKMMIVVVLIFAVCWLPMHAYYLLTSHNKSITEYEYIQQIYIIIYLMAMYNPIIHGWMNARFREGFIHVFCCCPCRRCKRSRTKLRLRRTLSSIAARPRSEKNGSDRNGSMMHTSTECVDTESYGTRRSNHSHSTVRRESPTRTEYALKRNWLRK